VTIHLERSRTDGESADGIDEYRQAQAEGLSRFRRDYQEIVAIALCPVVRRLNG
jgi:hypothetical protein